MRDKKKKLTQLKRALSGFSRISVEYWPYYKGYFVVYYDYPNNLTDAFDIGEMIVIYDLKKQKYYNSNRFNPWDLARVKKVINEIWK